MELVELLSVANIYTVQSQDDECFDALIRSADVDDFTTICSITATSLRNIFGAEWRCIRVDTDDPCDYDLAVDIFFRTHILQISTSNHTSTVMFSPPSEDNEYMIVQSSVGEIPRVDVVRCELAVLYIYTLLMRMDVDIGVPLPIFEDYDPEEGTVIIFCD